MTEEEKDLFIYKNHVPYFQAQYSIDEKNSFPQEYINLSPNAKKAFRQMVNYHIDQTNYNEYKKLSKIGLVKCNKQKYDILLCLSKREFIELYDFLNFMCFAQPEFHVLFIHYFYSMRGDNQFMRETAFIHKRPEFIYLDYYARNAKQQYLYIIKMWLIIFGLDENMPLADAAEEFKRRGYDPNDTGGIDSLRCYAHCLFYGLGVKQDRRAARKIYEIGFDAGDPDCTYEYLMCKNYINDKSPNEISTILKCNWEKNNHLNSLLWYAKFVTYTAESSALHNLGWEKYLFAPSLYEYAEYLELDLREFYWRLRGKSTCSIKKRIKSRQRYAQHLHKLNWDENKHGKSLCNYIYYLWKGTSINGGLSNDEIKNKAEARRLLELGAEYKNPQCMYTYAEVLKYGIDGPVDKKKAFELFKYNYLENDHLESGTHYGSLKSKLSYFSECAIQ